MKLHFKSLLLIILGTAVLGDTKINGGLLTCTPDSLNKPPSVYMFNQKYLTKKDGKKNVYRKLGEFRSYMLFMGLIPNAELRTSLLQYQKSFDYFSKKPEQSIEYLELFEGGCKGSTNYTQKEMRDEFSKSSTFQEEIGAVPVFWGVTCNNISNVMETGKLPKPTLNDDNHHISKITIDTRNWEIVEENSMFCEECVDLDSENPVYGESFWNSTTSCVIVKLDKVEIEVTDDLIDENEV